MLAYLPMLLLAPANPAQAAPAQATEPQEQVPTTRFSPPQR